MYLRFQITIGHGTRTMKKSSSRFARVCGKNAKRLDQRRKKKAKAEAEKIGKDATDSRERACSGRL